MTDGRAMSPMMPLPCGQLSEGAFSHLQVGRLSRRLSEAWSATGVPASCFSSPPQTRPTGRLHATFQSCQALVYPRECLRCGFGGGGGLDHLSSLFSAKVHSIGSVKWRPTW